MGLLQMISQTKEKWKLMSDRILGAIWWEKRSDPASFTPNHTRDLINPQLCKGDHASKNLRKCNRTDNHICKWYDYILQFFPQWFDTSRTDGNGVYPL